MASTAFCLMSAGAGQSGKPWPRFTAPYFAASRLISRMTDSVKLADFREMRFLDILGCMYRDGILTRNVSPKAANHRSLRTHRMLLLKLWSKNHLVSGSYVR